MADYGKESGFRAIKLLVLGALTILVAIPIISTLVGSLNEPQVTSRLQLYQTDLLLQATEWQGGDLVEADEAASFRQALVGQEPLETAIEQYESVREEAEENLARSQTQLEELAPVAPAESGLEPTTSSPRQILRSINQLQPLINQLDLRLGILKTETGQRQAALKIWSQIEPANSANAPDAAATSSDASSPNATATETAQVLTGLWSDPAQIAPNAETVVQQNLDGWFRYRALEQLYELQQRQDARAELAATEQAVAQQTFIKLLFIGALPVMGSIAGVGIAISLSIQWLIKRRQSILAHNRDVRWQVPWNWETIWQVFVVGFFFVGQFLLPILLGIVGVNGSQFSGRERAIYSLAYYLLMSAGGIAVLYWSIRTYLPLPADWFKFKLFGRWPLWGVGGYLVALPLMIGVSLVNQQIWNGQGGSNPLLQTVLEEGDSVALILFFLTAAIAAPLFEETLFRGFLLPSLTRYMPVSGAILASSLLFAIAHLSFSEVLPLTTLGMVLGFIYSRSRNLLAPMLLHSLWNSATMISLFILGSSAR